MISERDVEFHTPSDADYHWAETNQFCFHIPEQRIAGVIYTCIRKGLGVCSSEVIIFNQLSRDRWDALYFDSHEHLPAPASLSQYSLPNGLSVRAVQPPRDYRIDYCGTSGSELHLDVTGLMPPYDIHDPEMAPTASVDEHVAIERSGFGAGYSGHFDMTGHVTGVLDLYGRAFPVDCVDTMDHSWGPRTERGMRPMCWSGGHFGEDLVWHGIWQKDPFADAAHEFRLANGYVLSNGEVLGLTSGKMLVERNNGIAVKLRVMLTDRTGREHVFTASALANHDWVPHTCLHVHNVFYEFQSGNRTGYGVVQEALPLDMMARESARSSLLVG